eukprot:14850336-Ditylum_brightwellii.AAC.1
MPGALVIGGTPLADKDLILVELDPSNHSYLDAIPGMYTYPLPPKGRFMDIVDRKFFHQKKSDFDINIFLIQFLQIITTCYLEINCILPTP